MRTFVLRARKGAVITQRGITHVGTGKHIEIIAHTLANAFYYSKAMRDNIEVYIILDSMPDFPRTVKFSSNSGLSFQGFHEEAFLIVLREALQQGKGLRKDETLKVLPGVELSGFGFDRLMKGLQASRSLYLLDKKGIDIRDAPLAEDGVYILTDHIPMPKNSIKGLERGTLHKISLGNKMLFASQCIVLIHNELDRQFD